MCDSNPCSVKFLKKLGCRVSKKPAGSGPEHGGLPFPSLDFPKAAFVLVGLSRFRETTPLTHGVMLPGLDRTAMGKNRQFYHHASIQAANSRFKAGVVLA
jgi:hypothetical protein